MEVGNQTWRSFACSKCKRKKAFEGHSEWVNHLMTKGHQKTSKQLFENWKNEWNTRSLVIEIQPKLKKLAKKEVNCILRKCPNVIDCILKLNRFFVICIFETPTFRDEAVAVELPNKDVIVKCCNDLTKDDWSLLLTSNDNIFQSHANANNCQILNEISEKKDLKSQMDVLRKNTTLDEEGLATRIKIVEILSASLRKSFPHCMLYPFGSTVTRLGDKNSDIDILVDIEGNAEEGISLPNDAPKPWIKEFQKVVKKVVDPDSNTQICQAISPISKSRVPFIHATFICKSQIVNCDLSFTNILGVRNTDLICLYMGLDPRVRLLMHLVRYWGKFHNLISSTSIKNYAMALLVIVFFCRRKIVPTILELQNVCNYPLIVNGFWNSNFCRDREKIQNLVTPNATYIDQNEIELSTLDFAQQFFEEMSQIDFSTTAVCTLTAEYIPKELYGPDQYFNLPDPLDSFKSWMHLQLNKKTNQNPKTLKQMKSKSKIDCCFSDAKVVIQDPFDLSSNVGSSASKKHITNFRNCCLQTAAHLRTMLTHFHYEVNLTDMFQAYVKPEVEESVKNEDSQTKEKKVPDLKTPLVSTKIGVSAKLDKSTDMFQLISKSISTLLSESTFETGITFQVGSDYSQLLNDAFDNKEIPVSYADLTNRLWICFALEFFENVWQCFTVDLINEKIVVQEDSLERVKLSTRNDQFNMFVQYLNSNQLYEPRTCSRDCLSTMLLLKKVSWLIDKDVVTVIRCQLHRNVWAQRDSYFVDAQQGTNPLTYEWQITEQLLKFQDAAQENFLPGKAKFYAGVKISYDRLQCDILPAVHMVLKLETSRAHCHQFFSFLKKVYPDLLAKYAVFRLFQTIHD